MIEHYCKPLIFQLFCLMPEGFRLLEGGVFGLPVRELRAGLEGYEPAAEFGVRGAKRVLRVELHKAGEIRRRGDEIARFLRGLGELS